MQENAGLNRIIGERGKQDAFFRKRGKEEAFLDRYADMVLRIAVHNVGSLPDAEDVAQEVFLKRIAAKRAFQSLEHEKAWMIRVTLNQCRDFLRAAHRKDVALDENIPCEKPDTEVLDAVLRLPVDFRNVIYLHYYEGLRVSEIARILHRRENTVASRLRRAREALTGGGSRGGNHAPLKQPGARVRPMRFSQPDFFNRRRNARGMRTRFSLRLLWPDFSPVGGRGTAGRTRWVRGARAAAHRPNPSGRAGRFDRKRSIP